jgi:hypothetical protein
MMRRLLLLLTMLSAQSLSAAELPAADHWELGMRVGGAITDNSYSLDGSVETLSLLRTLGPKAAIELEVTADQLDFGIDYGLKHRSFAVNYLSINREPLWDPYFLVGAGAIQFDSPEAIDKGTDAMLQAAVGGTWQLLESGKLLFRAERFQSARPGRFRRCHRDVRLEYSVRGQVGAYVGAASAAKFLISLW